MWSSVAGSLATVERFKRCQPTRPENVAAIAWNREGLKGRQTSTTLLSGVGFAHAEHEVDDAGAAAKMPEISDVEQLQSFVATKRHQVWMWPGVNHSRARILAWVVGDRSRQTFQQLWLSV